MFCVRKPVPLVQWFELVVNVIMTKAGVSMPVLVHSMYNYLHTKH